MTGQRALSSASLYAFCVQYCKKIGLGSNGIPCSHTMLLRAIPVALQKKNIEASHEKVRKAENDFLTIHV